MFAQYHNPGTSRPELNWLSGTAPSTPNWKPLDSKPWQTSYPFQTGFGASFNDAQQSALNFLVSQLSIIEPTVYRTRYPDIQYPKLIPVDSTGNEWAKSITFFSADQVGKADWFHHMANDVPLADVTRDKHEIGIEMAAVGYHYTLEELGQAMMVPGTNLQADRAMAARRAYEEFVDDVALRGNSTKGWTGLINDPTIDVVQAATDGNGGSAAFDEKTADQVLRDLNSALTGIYTDTLTVETADTILMPVQSVVSLATRRLGDVSDKTILNFFTANNMYTAVTQQPLTIIGVRGLESAGTGGTGRMVAYRRSDQVLKLHIPMPHRFLPVWQRAPLRFDVPGIFRLSPLEIRLPKAVRYIDGISAVPYE